jgi:cellulose synthase/poly-beta-1,6-N-acetylglucosamine synthase-like glycosyltransferase
MYFDRRVGWASSCDRRLYDLDSHRQASALYPYSSGIFGTGANFAFDRAFLLGIGGFDEALGAGSRARGGEDLDVFVRTLHAGRAIAYEPAAIAWHLHRTDLKELRRQMFAYGLGAAAFATKYLTTRSTTGDVLLRLPHGLLHAARLLLKPQAESSTRSPALLPLWEALGMAAGPGAYLLSRRQSRRMAGGRASYAWSA